MPISKKKKKKGLRKILCLYNHNKKLCNNIRKCICGPK